MDCRLDNSIVVMSNFLNFITILWLYEIIIAMVLGNNTEVLKIKGYNAWRKGMIYATNPQTVQKKIRTMHIIYVCVCTYTEIVYVYVCMGIYRDVYVCIYIYVCV